MGIIDRWRYKQERAVWSRSSSHCVSSVSVSLCGGRGTAGHYKEQKLSELCRIRRRIRLSIHFECDSATVLRHPGSIPTHDAFILAQYGSIGAGAPWLCIGSIE